MTTVPRIACGGLLVILGGYGVSNYLIDLMESGYISPVVDDIVKIVIFGLGFLPATFLLISGVLMLFVRTRTATDVAQVFLTWAVVNLLLLDGSMFSSVEQLFSLASLDLVVAVVSIVVLIREYKLSDLLGSALQRPRR